MTFPLENLIAAISDNIDLFLDNVAESKVGSQFHACQNSTSFRRCVTVRHCPDSHLFLVVYVDEYDLSTYDVKTKRLFVPLSAVQEPTRAFAEKLSRALSGIQFSEQGLYAVDAPIAVEELQYFGRA